jgi:hypothetical protein
MRVDRENLRNLDLAPDGPMVLDGLDLESGRR